MRNVLSTIVSLVLITAAGQASTPQVMTSLCCADGSSVSIIDTAENTLTGTAPRGLAVSLVAFSPDGQTVYYFDSGAFKILAVSTATGAVTQTIPTAKSAAYAMVVAKDGSAIYLAIGASVAVYSTANGSSLATISLPAVVTGLALSPDGSKVYAVADVPGPQPLNVAAATVATPTSSLLAALSTATNSVVGFGRIPYDSQAVAITPDGKTLFVGYISDFVHGAGVVSVNAATLKKTGNIADPSPNVLSVTPNGSYLVVGGSGGVRFYSLPGGQLAGQAATAGAVSALAVKPDASAVYAATGSADSVQAISIPGFSVTASLTVGNGPSSIAFQPGSANVFVTNPGPSTVLKLDASAMKVVGYQAALHEPFQFAPGPNGTIYVTEYQSNTVAQLDANGHVLARVTVEQNPQNLATSPDRSRLYVANRLGQSGFTPSISAIDTATNLVVNRWDVPQGTIEQSVVAVSPDGGTVYVGSVSLFAFDAATGVQKNALTIPNENVYFLAVMPDGQSLYTSGIAGVYQVSTSSFTVMASVKIGDGCYLPIALRPDGKEVWVADSDDQQIGVINTANNTLSTIALTTAPLWFAFTADSSEAFAATGKGICIVSGGPAPGVSVLKLSTAQHAVTGSILVGGPQTGLIAF
jgi:DNA-binding beta-propeller fold protein YncE